MTNTTTTQRIHFYNGSRSLYCTGRVVGVFNASAKAEEVTCRACLKKIARAEAGMAEQAKREGW